MSTKALTPDHRVDADTPLRLHEAARIAFPDGSVSAQTLRRERDRGRLAVERIAGKDYTTLGAIQEMRRLCRVGPQEPASTSKPSASVAARSSPPAGASATVD